MRSRPLTTIDHLRLCDGMDRDLLSNLRPDVLQSPLRGHWHVADLRCPGSNLNYSTFRSINTAVLLLVSVFQPFAGTGLRTCTRVDRRGHDPLRSRARRLLQFIISSIESKVTRTGVWISLGGVATLTWNPSITLSVDFSRWNRVIIVLITALQ
jgi:hypothetical protein